MEATTSIAVSELINLTQGIANINLVYLGICVTIVLFAGGISGGFFYLFNFKPLQKSISDQEKRIQSLSQKSEQKFNEQQKALEESEIKSIKNIKDLGEGIKKEYSNLQLELSKQIEDVKISFQNHDEALKKIESKATSDLEILSADVKKDYIELKTKLETDINDLRSLVKNDLEELNKKQKVFELNAIFNEHYLWQMTNVRTNDLDSLIRYIEKAYEYQMTQLVGIALQQIAWLLSLPDFSTDVDLRKPDFQRRLTEILSKNIGFNDEKNKVSSLMYKLA